MKDPIRKLRVKGPVSKSRNAAIGRTRERSIDGRTWHEFCEAGRESVQSPFVTTRSRGQSPKEQTCLKPASPTLKPSTLNRSFLANAWMFTGSHLNSGNRSKSLMWFAIFLHSATNSFAPATVSSSTSPRAQDGWPIQTNAVITATRWAAQWNAAPRSYSFMRAGRCAKSPTSNGE